MDSCASRLSACFATSLLALSCGTYGETRTAAETSGGGSAAGAGGASAAGEGGRASGSGGADDGNAMGGVGNVGAGNGGAAGTNGGAGGGGETGSGGSDGSGGFTSCAGAVCGTLCGFGPPSSDYRYYCVPSGKCMMFTGFFNPGFCDLLCGSLSCGAQCGLDGLGFPVVCHAQHHCGMATPMSCGGSGGSTGGAGAGGAG